MQTGVEGSDGGESGEREGGSGDGVKGEVEERETAPLTLCSVKLSTVHSCDHYEKRGRRGGGEEGGGGRGGGEGGGGGGEGGRGGGGGGGGGEGGGGGGGRGITDLFSNNISQGSVVIIQSR